MLPNGNSVHLGINSSVVELVPETNLQILVEGWSFFGSFYVLKNLCKMSLGLVVSLGNELFTIVPGEF